MNQAIGKPEIYLSSSRLERQEVIVGKQSIFAEIAQDIACGLDLPICGGVSQIAATEVEELVVHFGKERISFGCGKPSTSILVVDDYLVPVCPDCARKLLRCAHAKPYVHQLRCGELK